MTAPLADARTAGAPEGSPPAAPPPGLAGVPVDNSRSATNDASIITASTYAAQGLSFLAGLIQKGLLGPAGAGYWALMQSFWEIIRFVTIGAFTGVGRQVPLHRGREDYEAAASVANTGTTFSLVVLAFAGGLLATFSLAFGGGWAPEIQYGLVILGVTSPIRMLSDAHETLLSATRRFRPVAWATLAQALIALSLQTAAVALFGFYGMFIGVVLAAIGSLILWMRMGLTGLRRPAFTWQIDRDRLKELIVWGFPILVFGQIWLLFMGIDNLIIAGFVGVTDLGYYALAVSVTSYILIMPKSISAALFPRMVEDFGKSGEVKSMTGYATDVQRLLAYVLVPIFMAGAFYLLPVLIRHALPEFTPAIEVVQIMVVGSFFISLCNMPIKTIITAGQRGPLIGIIAVCLGINAAANYIAVAVLDKGIEGAAVATSISYLVVFLATSGYALKMLLGAREMLPHIGEIVAAGVYVTAALWAIEELVGSGAGSLVPDAAIGSGKLLAFVIVLTPWLMLAERRVSGVTRMVTAGRKALAAVKRR